MIYDEPAVKSLTLYAAQVGAKLNEHYLLKIDLIPPHWLFAMIHDSWIDSWDTSKCASLIAGRYQSGETDIGYTTSP